MERYFTDNSFTFRFSELDRKAMLPDDIEKFVASGMEKKYRDAF